MAAAKPMNAPAKPMAAAAKPSLPKLVPIYFRTDSAEIEDISLPLIDATAEALKGNAQQSVAIQGHADERGSDEYNTDLTERRAQAVSQALQARGVSASQLQTTGYGSEHPVCTANGEDCWSQNRRVDIVPTAFGG
jgi:peptidoglycan-associated lipoprotein